jgi:hypothetical protein
MKNRSKIILFALTLVLTFAGLWAVIGRKHAYANHKSGYHHGYQKYGSKMNCKQSSQKGDRNQSKENKESIK